MLESLQVSFSAIAPIFLLLSLGYGIRKIRLVEESVFAALNKLIFRVFLPILLFYNLYSSDVQSVMDGKLIGFCVAAVLVLFVIGYAAVHVLTKDHRRRGVMAQAFFRSNFAILGIPIVDYVCRGKTDGRVSMVIAVLVPLFNVLAVVVLERFRGGKVKVGRLLKGILTNPLIVACAVGGLFLACGIRLPSVVEEAVSGLSDVASPLAMVVLGAGFTFSGLKGYARELTAMNLVKLVFAPMLALSAAVLCGFRGESLACVLAGFGAPMAVSSFSMAQEMDADSHLAAQGVVTTSALSMVTMFLWVFVLSMCRWI